MSAPGGIEFNENVLGGVHDNFLELFSNKFEDGLVLSFRDIFGFINGGESSGGEVSDEFLEAFGGDISGVFIFINSSFFGGINDSDAGSLGIGDSDVISESFSESVGNLGGGHQDLSLQFSGSGVKGSSGGGGGFVSADEEEESGEIISKDSLGCGLIKVHDSGERVGINPGFNGIGGEFSGIVQLWFFEGSEEHEGVLRDSIGGGEVSVERVSKDNFIEEFGDIEVGFEGIGGGFASEVESDDLGLGSEGFDFFSGVLFRGGGGNLLLDPAHDGGLGSSSSVFGGLSVHKPFKSGESLDSVSACKLFVFSGIDVREGDLGLEVLEGGGGFFVLGGEGLAVSAPGGVEFNQNVGVGFDGFVERFGVKNQHVGC